MRRGTKTPYLFTCDHLEQRTLLSGYAAVLSLPATTASPVPVDVSLSAYSFGATSTVVLRTSGDNATAPSYTEITATADFSIASPQLFADLTSATGFPTAKLTLYQDGSPVLQQSLQTVFINGITPTGSPGASTQEQLSIYFSSITETTTLATPPISTSDGSQVLSFIPFGSSSTVQIQVNSANWAITAPSGSKATFSSFNASEAAFTPGSVELLSLMQTARSTTLVTLTQYGPGGVPTVSYSMQDVYVSSTTTSADSSGPADSFGLTYGTMTVDYAPTLTTASISTWNIETETTSTLPSTPAPPSGTLQNGGGSPGLTSDTSAELDLGTTTGGLTFAGIILLDSSINETGKGTAPTFTFDAPLGSDAPAWLAVIGAGSVYTTADIVYRKKVGGSTTSTTLHEIKLSSVLVTSMLIQTGDSGFEHITLTGTQTTETVTPQAVDGTLLTPVVRSWNFQTEAVGSGGNSGQPPATAPVLISDAVISFPAVGGGVAVKYVLDSFALTGSNLTSYTNTGSRASWEDLTADFHDSPFAPELMELESFSTVMQTVTVAIYNASGTATASLALSSVTVSNEGESNDGSDSSVDQHFSLHFTSITQTYAAAASSVPTPNSETMQFTLPSASAATTLLISDSSWEISSPSDSVGFSTYNASSNSPAAFQALSSAIVNSSNLTLVTVTDYSVGVSAQSFYMQDAFVQSYGLSYGSGGTSVSFALNMASVTEDYAPTTSPSIATYSINNGAETPLTTTPQPPTGTLVANGSSPGVSTSTPMVLTLSTAPAGSIGVGPIDVLSFSYGLTLPVNSSSGSISLGRAVSPVITIDAILGSDAPDWLRDVDRGSVFTSAVLTVLDSAGATTNQYTLGAVSVQSFQLVGSGFGAAGVFEQIQLKPGQMTVAFVPPSSLATVSQSFNFTTNASNGSAGSVLESLAGPTDYLRRDPSAATLDVWYGTAPTGTPDYTVSIPQLTLLELAPTQSVGATITIDYSNGDPISPQGLAIDGSRGVQSLALVVIGSTGAEEISFNASSVTTAASFGTQNLTYASVSSITLNGNGGSDAYVQSAQPSAPVVLAGDNSRAVLKVLAGTFTFAAPASGSGVTLDILSSLVVANNASLVLASTPSQSPSDRTLLEFASLGISPAGIIDIGRNDLDEIGGSLDNLNGLARTGFAAGAWTGYGITSSAAAADSTHLTSVGVIQNAEGGAPVFTASNLFDGIVPGSNDVLVRYTYLGDANLDGHVDGNDYTLIDHGFTAHLTGWFNGDFNYDNSTNGSDYTLMDNVFNTQGASLASQITEAVSVKSGSHVAAAAHPIFSNAPIALSNTWAIQATSSAAAIFADTLDDDALAALASR